MLQHRLSEHAQLRIVEFTGIQKFLLLHLGEKLMKEQILEYLV